MHVYQQLPYHIILHILRFIKVEAAYRDKPYDSYGYFVRDPERKVVRIFDMFPYVSLLDKGYIIELLLKGAEIIEVSLSYSVLDENTASALEYIATLTRNKVLIFYNDLNYPESNGQDLVFMKTIETIKSTNIEYSISTHIHQNQHVDYLKKVLALNHYASKVHLDFVARDILPNRQLQLQNVWDQVQPKRVTVEINFWKRPFDPSLPMFQKSFWKVIGPHVTYLTLSFTNIDDHRESIRLFLQNCVAKYVGPKFSYFYMPDCVATLWLLTNSKAQYICITNDMIHNGSMVQQIEWETLKAVAERSNQLYSGNYYCNIANKNVAAMMFVRNKQDGNVQVKSYYLGKQSLGVMPRHPKNLLIQDFWEHIANSD